MVVKLRQFNITEIRAAHIRHLNVTIVLIGARNWLNSLFVGGSWVTVRDNLRVYLLF